ncbi:MAG: biotin--[acetyl-CoA-carboxylase] ligase [Fimbriimonadaceae bacterium]|nr:biotin--[acetyl-CoA-carboxylase] ligase [Chitinophagales bacterium]
MRPIPNTIFIGKVLHHLDRVDSTNAYLQYLIAASADRLTEGLTVFADEQFAGKGQMGAGWVSEPGKNIIASILLYPKFLLPKQIFYLNKAIAVAVCDFLKSYSDNIKIKWPNDIYFENKKMAGILIENSLSTNAVEQSIIGMGININQEIFDTALLNPTSLRAITHKNYDLELLFHALCAEIEKQYLLLRSFQFKKIDDLYHESLFGLNEEKIFTQGDETFTGIIRGVNEYGKLIVEKEEGLFEFGAKEVRIFSIG